MMFTFSRFNTFKSNLFPWLLLSNSLLESLEGEEEGSAESLFFLLSSGEEDSEGLGEPLEVGDVDSIVQLKRTTAAGVQGRV